MWCRKGDASRRSPSGWLFSYFLFLYFFLFFMKNCKFPAVVNQKISHRDPILSHPHGLSRRIVAMRRRGCRGRRRVTGRASTVANPSIRGLWLFFKGALSRASDPHASLSADRWPSVDKWTDGGRHDETDARHGDRQAGAGAVLGHSGGGGELHCSRGQLVSTPIGRASPLYNLRPTLPSPPPFTTAS